MSEQDLRDAQKVDDPVDYPYADISCIRHGLPDEWVMYIHPQGWIYFRNEKFHVVTDEDTRDGGTLLKLNDYCASLTQLPSEGHEVYVLGLTEPSLGLYINHKQCFATFDYKQVSGDAMHDLSILSLVRRRRLYYNYLQQHPSHVPTPREAFKEAVDAIKSFVLDQFISGTRSVAPFSKQECEDLLRALETVSGKENENSPASTALLSWILKDTYGFRLGDQYGRFTRKQLIDTRSSSHLPPKATQLPPFALTTLNVVINGPFFGIPKTYLAHAKNASEFRGRLVDLQENWESYARQLTREYSDFVLASTVLLSATMGFLSVSDIEEIAKTLAVVSVFASLSSIIVGVFFIWRHHRPVSSSHTMAYIHNARNNLLGLPGHAILLSLPPVFLVWSIIAFAGAVLAYTLQFASATSASIWTIFCIFVVFLILLLIGLFTFSKMWVWKSNGIWSWSSRTSFS